MNTHYIITMITNMTLNLTIQEFHNLKCFSRNSDHLLISDSTSSVQKSVSSRRSFNQPLGIEKAFHDIVKISYDIKKAFHDIVKVSHDIEKTFHDIVTVSYTHLTLPTKA